MFRAKEDGFLVGAFHLDAGGFDPGLSFNAL